MRLLNNVSKIILTFTLFFMSSIFASTYNLDINLINLIIAMFCIITFNSFNSNHYIRIFQILLASILILTSVLFNMKSYNVWLFTIFILSTILINHKKDITISSKALIFIAIFFNLNIISNTNYADIQYDFASNLNYIQYILENNFIFWQENPILTRPSYSTYHPILHYFIFALGLKTATLITDSYEAALNSLQILTVFYMFIYYITVNNILKLFKFDDKTHILALTFICFFPFNNVLSGLFNNDCLLLPLQALSIYYSLLYSQDGKIKNLALITLFTTLSCLTKLSGIIILPFIGIILLHRLIFTKNISEFKNIIIWGIITLIGISIWPTYQHFILHQDLGYIPHQPDQSVLSYNLIERFNPLQAILYTKLFYNEQCINLFETLTKTALFGQYDFSFRCNDILPLLNLITINYKILLIISFISICYIMLKKFPPQTYIIIFLLFTIIGTQILFNIRLPYICSQHFRFIPIIILPTAICIATASSKMSRLFKIIIFALITNFAILSTLIWWWAILPIN